MQYQNQQTSTYSSNTLPAVAPVVPTYNSGFVPLDGPNSTMTNQSMSTPLSSTSQPTLYQNSTTQPMAWYGSNQAYNTPTVQPIKETTTTTQSFSSQNIGGTTVQTEKFETTSNVGNASYGTGYSQPQAVPMIGTQPLPMDPVQKQMFHTEKMAEKGAQVNLDRAKSDAYMANARNKSLPTGSRVKNGLEAVGVRLKEGVHGMGKEYHRQRATH